MPEGLSASEVGKEIGQHAKHADTHERQDPLISITEAVLLSIVALMMIAVLEIPSELVQRTFWAEVRNYNIVERLLC
jgi:hypothetical protein